MAKAITASNVEGRLFAATYFNLEELGWDFDNSDYKFVAEAQGLDIRDAEVRASVIEMLRGAYTFIEIDDDGNTYHRPPDGINLETGDDKQTIADLITLAKEHKLKEILPTGEWVTVDLRGEDSSKAKYNLEKREHCDAFRLHCIEQISESQRTWEDVDVLHSLSYREYFGACIDENGAMYNSAEHYPEDLEVSADQFEPASAIFQQIMSQCKDDYFQEH